MTLSCWYVLENWIWNKLTSFLWNSNWWKCMGFSTWLNLWVRDLNLHKIIFLGDLLMKRRALNRVIVIVIVVINLLLGVVTWLNKSIIYFTFLSEEQSYITVCLLKIPFSWLRLNNLNILISIRQFGCVLTNLFLRRKAELAISNRILMISIIVRRNAILLLAYENERLIWKLSKLLS